MTIYILLATDTFQNTRAQMRKNVNFKIQKQIIKKTHLGKINEMQEISEEIIKISSQIA